MNGLDETPLTQPIEAQPPSKQSLLLDGFRRLEEHSPVWMLPRLITTQHLQKSLSAARERVCDGHKAQMKLMGADVENCGDGGGISVQGDTTINNNGLKTCGVAGLIIAALLAGGIATVLYLHCNKPTANVIAKAPQDSWKLGLHVSNSP